MDVISGGGARPTGTESIVGLEETIRRGGEKRRALLRLACGKRGTPITYGNTTGSATALPRVAVRANGVTSNRIACDLSADLVGAARLRGAELPQAATARQGTGCLALLVRQGGRS